MGPIAFQTAMPSQNVIRRACFLCCYNCVVHGALICTAINGRFSQCIGHILVDLEDREAACLWLCGSRCSAAAQAFLRRQRR
eukprot:6037390-Pleurochrysis_carterae.AAC.1